MFAPTVSMTPLPNGEQLMTYDKKAQIKESHCLLLVHGNLGSHIWWQHIIKAMSCPSFRIIAVDLRGFGESTYNHPCEKFGDWANDLALLCQVKQLKKVIAVGLSFGGGVCMKLAEMRPDLVEGLVLTGSVSPQGLVLYEGEEPCRTRPQILANKKTKFMQNAMLPQNIQVMRGVYNTILFPKMPTYPQDHKDKLIRTSFQQRCYLDLLYALANSDIDITKIKCRTLSIHGQLDPVIPLKTIEESARQLGQLSIWPEHMHMVPLEDIKRYVSQIGKFLAAK